MRDPDKPIPDPGLEPEGQPIPAGLGLCCPECGHPLAGVRQWVCPSCGEGFNPMRLHTLRMLEQPEYFLRYQVDPADIRKGFWAAVLVATGLGLALLGTLIALLRGQARLPIETAWSLMSLIAGLTAAPTIALHFVLDISWPRVAFFFSVPWLLMCTLLLVLACF